MVSDRAAIERTPDSDAIPMSPHGALRSPHLSDAYFPALDGVRGIAILWVMLFHMNVVAPLGAAGRAWSAFCGNGGLGVEIFFVLSGFLITGILYDTRLNAGYFRNFYARRLLRIFPLYYLVVAFCLLVLPHISNSKSDKFNSVQHDAIFYWLHLSNFAIARRGRFVHGILDVSWSLAIEEQFYLVWPAVVLLLKRRALMFTCLVLVAISVISRIVLWREGASTVAIYTLTFCRMDGLCIGAWLGLFVRHGGGRRFGALPLVLAGVAVVCWMVWTAASNSFLSVAATYPAIAVATAAVILTCVRGHAPVLNSVLAAPPLRLLGRLSYALYLFHYPLMAVLRDKLLLHHKGILIWGSSLPGQLVFDAVGVAVSVGAAWLSWSLFEKRILRLKRFFPKPGSQKANPLREQRAS